MRLVDPNGVPIDAPSKSVYKDGTGTPQVSPVTPGDASLTKLILVPPPGALYCVFRTAEDCTVSNDAANANGVYTVTAHQDFRKPCGLLQPIYINTALQVYFSFEVL